MGYASDFDVARAWTRRCIGHNVRVPNNPRMPVTGLQIFSFTKRSPLLRTNHTATEVATLPDGTTFARGCLYHQPDGRTPDHARVKLPQDWCLIVKNTVPVTKRSPR